MIIDMLYGNYSTSALGREYIPASAQEIVTTRGSAINVVKVPYD